MARFFKGGAWNDAAGDYIQVGGLTRDLSTSWTVACWFWMEHNQYGPPTGPGGNAIWGCEDGTESSGFVIRFVYDSPFPYLEVRAPGAGFNNQASGGWQGTLAYHKWHHLVCSNSSGSLKIYLDGNAPIDTIGHDPFTTGTTAMFIGRAGDNIPDDSRLLYGMVEDWAYWDIALSGDEVQQAYRSGAAGVRVGSLQAHLPLTGLSTPEQVFGAQSGTITITDNGAPAPHPGPIPYFQSKRRKAALRRVAMPNAIGMPRSWTTLGTGIGKRQLFSS